MADIQSQACHSYVSVLNVSKNVTLRFYISNGKDLGLFDFCKVLIMTLAQYCPFHIVVDPCILAPSSLQNVCTAHPESYHVRAPICSARPKELGAGAAGAGQTALLSPHTTPAAPGSVGLGIKLISYTSAPGSGGSPNTGRSAQWLSWEALRSVEAAQQWLSTRDAAKFKQAAEGCLDSKKGESRSPLRAFLHPKMQNAILHYPFNVLQSSVWHRIRFPIRRPWATCAR